MDVLPLCKCFGMNDGRSSTIPSQLIDQGHSQESKISAAITDSVTPSEPFLFFKLPAELRNMIYHLLVDTERTLLVRNMHLREFEKSQESGAYQSRSTYVATDQECKSDFGYPNINSCLVKDKRFEPMKTTYTLATPLSTETMTTTMLSLDKQSREEVASIFYGGNTFHFTTMSTLTPFMEDRTAETRKYIQSLRLTLTPNGRNWDAIFAEQGVSALWNKAFSSFLKLSYVNIKKLCIRIDDKKAKIFVGGLNLRSRSMLWLHKLRKIDSLELLGLEYSVRGWQGGQQQQQDSSGTSTPVPEEVNTAIEQELWRFLAPKMLKKEADDHSADALQHRRIRDTHKNYHTYLSLICSDHGSDIGPDHES